MQRPIAKRIAAPILLLLTLFAFVPGAAVLCVGSDGHMHVERADFSNCCAPQGAAAESAAKTRVASIAAGQACGSCLDTPLDLKAIVSDSTAKSMASLTQLPVGYLPSLTPLPVLARCVTFSVTATPAIPPAVLTAGVLRL